MTQGSLHEPTKLQRDTVKLHAMIGTPQEDIARVIGIDAKTLRLHYREELDLAIAMANATIGGALFNKAKGGDTAAMIFWMKTRARWSEKIDIDHGLQESNTLTTLLSHVMGKTLEP